jgi:hypothetical protein
MITKLRWRGVQIMKLFFGNFLQLPFMTLCKICSQSIWLKIKGTTNIIQRSWFLKYNNNLWNCFSHTFSIHLVHRTSPKHGLKHKPG